MNKQEFINGENSFPISTETLDFMQKQTLFLQQLTKAVGEKIIVKDCDANADGLIILNGELLPLEKIASHDDQCFIHVDETETSITANGHTYPNVRKTRKARYVASPEDNNDYARRAFTLLEDMETLMARIATLQTHQTPRGVIVMWSGEIANIPAGWALCDGQNGTPDLRERFIVGATDDVDDFGYPVYPVGETGGEARHQLTTAEMPRHRHGITAAWDTFDGSANEYNKLIFHKAQNETTFYDYLQGGNSACEWVGGDGYHENRPPYYALAFIMKVI